jgi:hypothetical protein
LAQNTTITLGGIQKKQTVLVASSRVPPIFSPCHSRAGVTHRIRQCRWGEDGRIDSDWKHSDGNHHP